MCKIGNRESLKKKTFFFNPIESGISGCACYYHRPHHLVLLHFRLLLGSLSVRWFKNSETFSEHIKQVEETVGTLTF